MNQNRWTCLTTAVLSTVIVPIATVDAKTLTSSVMDGGSYSPLSPQSLPVITPLTVTELETEAAIPAAIQPVPQVSKLPIIVTPLLGHARAQALGKQHKKIAKAQSLPTKNLSSQSPATRPTAPSYNPNSLLTVPIFAIPNPIDSSAPQVNAVAPLPQITAERSKSKTANTVTSFTSQTASAPIVVVRSDKVPTVIQHSATVQAETARIPQPKISGFERPNPPKSPLATATTIDRSALKTVPQVAPIVSQTTDSADLPSFESGLPVFVFDRDRPQQIVATAIAQVDDTIVSSEPSIAIPVQRPKQSTIPARLPIAPATSVTQPLETEIVKIEPPAATTTPALDQIVATQTGKASWYGSEAGSMTANGEKYNPSGLTAAHPTLPFGTQVRITSIKTGKFVTVRINDRGPFRSRRIIDISAGAAQIIGIKNDGVGEVRMEVLGREG